MLFRKASDYLTDQIGPPTTVVGPPRRLRAWVLRNNHAERAPFEVKLRNGLPGGVVKVEIIDPHAGFAGAQEELMLLQETDFKIALERVQAHLER
jgi:hypothetical protein